MKSQTSAPLIRIIFLLWAMLGTLFFAALPGRASYVHWSTLQDIPLFIEKIGRIDALAYIRDLFVSCAGILIFSLANLSTGLAVFQLTKLGDRLPQSENADRMAFLGTAFLAGHGALSLAWMTLALKGWLNPVIISLVMLFGVILGLKPIRHTILPWLRARGMRESFPETRDRIFLAAGSTILILTLLYSSARLSYDSVAVYFSDAKLTALSGTIRYFTDDSFVVSIFHTAAQFSAIMQLFGDQTARLFSWTHGIVMILFSILIAEKTGLSRQARLYLFLSLVTSTAFMDLFGDGKVELVSSSPIMAAVYWMLVESRNSTSQKSLLLLVGFLLGLAMVARPYNIMLAGGLTGLYSLQYAFLGSWKKQTKPMKRMFDAAFWIGMGALVVGAYHLFANWYLLGNPFAMLANAAAVTPSKWQWAIDPEQLLLLRWLYPFVVTYLNTPQSLGTISPLLVGFLPALFIKEVREKIALSPDVRALSFISALVLLAWIFASFMVMEVRYVFFLWIFLYLPLSETIAKMFEHGPKIVRIVSSATIFFLLGFIALRTIFIAFDAYSPVNAQGNPQCNDSRFCDYLKSINQSAFFGDRVLTMGAFRYYLRTDLFACSTSHTEYQRLRAASKQGSLEFWEEVYRQGYKYIAYENDYTSRHLQFAFIPSPDNAPEWVSLEPIAGKPGDLQIAYRITATNPPIEVEASCQISTTGVWEVRLPAP